MDRLPPSRSLWLGVILPALVCCLSGCGGQGVHVSGKVTFNGRPVPAGKIYFIPDGAKGNSGPTGYADIKDGAYSTSSAGGKAAVGGPMIVAIEGVDPAVPVKAKGADTSGEETVAALFPRYETTVDLPKSNSNQDFEVPTSAARRRDEAERPFIDP